MASLTTTKLKVHYWPMLGRAGAAIRMLEHTNTDYEHVSDFPSISKLGSAWSGESDTFAPPIVIDGDFQISQSVAVTLYVGNKVGLDKGLNTYKAVQWLSDIVDLFELGFTKLREVDYYPTDGCEFYITLSKHGDGIKIPRIELLNSIESDLRG